ncbi:MAG TPA: response regulator transcription factor [Candidatus Eremiobacteraeota bacterium]|nr:MAG: Transcriptional regulatory protein DegU [bacterium ADurb.Bin363]HPZ06586.1 response regulator transcription factor [Candidatus Eremiobacteraeota bacterium]
MEKIKILIVDDQTLFCKLLRSVISQQKDMTVVGEAQDAQSTINLIHSKPVDIILMDIKLAKENGIKLTKEVLKLKPDIKIIILSAYDDDHFVIEAFKVGAAGYLLKNVEPDEITKAIRLAYNGDSPIQPKIATKLLEEFTRLSGKLQEDQMLIKADIFSSLTKREIEILKLLGIGMSNDQISKKLLISIKTVKTHISRIIDKLDVTDRFQAAMIAIHQGLIKIGK